ncbi:glycosyltransferase [Pelagicoccus sp. SDUM812002]|uniref:glycosyltransferase n=1 Tax=Pelagicoccus sp. SDUM812002 TaxID=3041266 RepID=UPI00280DF221|nr:glycosyltransferase [Pelagicoccus sp. SDUM812002]MDQ8184562.1 glycosyltransferase [Pelagicoccus sp. SDUM812002]
MRIFYVTTSFPVYSETFLQREVRAMIKAGVEMEILSLHRGEPDFEGHPVQRFSKWQLLKLFYLLPLACWRKGSVMMEFVREMNAHRPASALNLFENLLGFGAAIVLEKRIRDFEPDIVHCVWASAPAAFGMMAEGLVGTRFSTGAHAYDIFEHGGDWLIDMKCERACLVHVSTEVAKQRVQSLCDARKVQLIRRGLNELPAIRDPRDSCERLRIVCVARLVEKKGFPFQLEIYRRLKATGLDFEAKIIGDGPMEEEIRSRIAEFGLEEEVRLEGWLSEGEVLQRLAWADLLFHTGVVAASGDRDGLPNVVPEAMASGAVVIGSPVSGVVEAIEDGETGFLCAPWEPEAWVKRCEQLQTDAALRIRLSQSARAWVEREFVADRNTGYLLECLEVARGG